MRALGFPFNGLGCRDGHGSLRVRSSAFVIAFAIVLLGAPCAVRGGCVVSDDSGAPPCASIWYNNTGAHDSTPVVDTTRVDWMAQVPDLMLLSELSIPGTHDSHAFWGCTWPFVDPECVTCQSIPFDEQLKAGIRAVDIRIRHWFDHTWVYHGVCTQACGLGGCSAYEEFGVPCHCGGILPACVGFLQEHPTETILIRFKQECTVTSAVACRCDHNTRSFSEAIEHALETYAAGYVYQWPDDGCEGMPTLGQVRGKIVVLQNFQGDYEVGPYAGWCDPWPNSWMRAMTACDLSAPFGRGLAAVDPQTGKLFTFTVDGVRLERVGHHDTDATYTSVCSGQFSLSASTEPEPVLAVTACDRDELQLYSWGDLDAPWRIYPTGDFPVSALAVDFDCNSREDIIVANYGHYGDSPVDPGTLRLFRNVGTDFEWEDLWVGSRVRGVSTADLNGDCFPDLVTTHSDPVGAQATGVGMWVNNGGDSLDHYYSYTLTEPRFVSEAVAADFTGDGLDDVVVAHGILAPNTALTFFENTGAGMIAEPGISRPSGTRGLAAADIDNDGDLDLLAAKPGGVDVYLNDGDFNFPEQRAISGWRGPYPLVAEDFDGDSDVDVAAVEFGPFSDNLPVWGSNRVSIMRNEDDGTVWCPGKALGPYWSNLHIQDDFEVISHAVKWAAVEQHLEDAWHLYPMDELCVNFLSGIHWEAPWYDISCEQTPNYIAYDLNRLAWSHLKRVLNESPLRPRCGIIMADYPGPGLIDVIIGSNKFGKNPVTGEFFGPVVPVPGVSRGDATWGDYDGDGDLDFLLTGLADGPQYYASVFQNDGGSFHDINAGLLGVQDASAAWGDYDNDGELDLLVAGYAPYGPGSITRVYRNNAGTFEEVGADLPGVSRGSVAWGDCDNDGDLDILLTGVAVDTIGVSAYVSRIYRNTGGAFSDIEAELPQVAESSVAWADYDNDGDLDFVLTGVVEYGDLCYASVFRNDEGSFHDINAGLLGVRDGSAGWGDCDNDGDLDLLVAGYAYTPDESGPITCVYRNNAGAFEDAGADLPGVSRGSVAWGDCDNDGDLDVLLNGVTDTLSGDDWRISRVYRNDRGVFKRDYSWLAPTSDGSASWGDYDGDRDLDIVLTGWYQYCHIETVGLFEWVYTDPLSCSNVYENVNELPFNTRPAAPMNLSAAIQDSTVTFSWDAATDAETPSPGLSYNLRVGTTPGGSEIMSPMADAATGRRRAPQLGNVQQATSWTLRLSPGTYYWSVQAIDGCFVGSAFAEEQVLGDTPVEDAFYATLVDEERAVRLRWSLSNCPGGEGLSIYRATSSEGPYRCITSEPLPEVAHGSYVDDTAWPGATFWYELRALLPAGEELLATDIRASVSVPGSLVAGIRYVSPNPTHGHTTIACSLPPGWRSARLAIHDLTGRVVRRLDPGSGAQGWVTVDWDGTGRSGQRVASGVYFLRLEVDGDVASRRLVFLR
jgi:hypothetical protein